MKLVGVKKIVSKKTGSTNMILSLTDDSKDPNRVGLDVSTEFVPYDESFLALIGQEIEIHYRKGFDGKAYFDHLTVVGKEKN